MRVHPTVTRLLGRLYSPPSRNCIITVRPDVETEVIREALTGVPYVAILPSSDYEPIAQVARGVACSEREADTVLAALDRAGLTNL
jgi:phosphoglycolate phosphatase-like HAD superfamily hydrolase